MIEVLIVLRIIMLFAAFAYPTYASFVRESWRADRAQAAEVAAPGVDGLIDAQVDNQTEGGVQHTAQQASQATRFDSQ